MACSGREKYMTARFPTTASKVPSANGRSGRHPPGSRPYIQDSCAGADRRSVQQRRDHAVGDAAEDPLIRARLLLPAGRLEGVERGVVDRRIPHTGDPTPASTNAGERHQGRRVPWSQ